MILRLAVVVVPLFNAVCTSAWRHGAQKIKGSRYLPSALKFGHHLNNDQNLESLAQLALAFNPVGAHRSHLKHSRSRHLPPFAAKAYADFEIELKKPIGIKWMKKLSGDGVRVDRVTPGGSAAESTYVWKGDELLSVDGFDCTSISEAEADGALSMCSDNAVFEFRRRGNYGCIDFPDGKRTFGRPGESMKELVQRAGYTGVKFGCGEGKCGSCDMFVRHADTGVVKPMRLCLNSLQPASPEAGPWELLKRNHPEAKAAKKKEEERMKKMMQTE
jgi:ferredoxin